VVLFLGCWLVAMAIYRWKNYEAIGFAPPAQSGPVE